MEDTGATPILLELDDEPVELELAPPRRKVTIRGVVQGIGRAIALAAEWVFGVISLVLGLSILAALPVIQFVTLGYLLEASGRVATSGRLRDGLIGVRRAARVGGVVAGISLALIPLWFVDSQARSAQLISPGRGAALGLRWLLGVVTVLTFLHIFTACVRGGRLRSFLWPFGHPFWLARRLREGGLYTEARDGLWEFVATLHLPRFFRKGLVGFLGTMVWIALPATLIALVGRVPLLGVIGVLALAVVAPSLPFLQVHYAVAGRARALFAMREVRDRFRRAPWAFAFALLVMLTAAIPLYLLKIEMLPREAAWLPSLVFVIFLFPARVLIGWAYARSGRRERPRHWFFRALGRIAIFPAAALYVLVVFAAQYTSWGGALSLYEQHAFLLPVPFLNM
ncbi:MAG TPA: hypothetical protein VGY53_09220 [Isosphaeraceae bacterium]|nr:hypothetical protein [Isosphaeraceae bacterium]